MHLEESRVIGPRPNSASLPSATRTSTSTEISIEKQFVSRQRTCRPRCFRPIIPKLGTQESAIIITAVGSSQVRAAINDLGILLIGADVGRPIAEKPRKIYLCTISFGVLFVRKAGRKAVNESKRGTNRATSATYLVIHLVPSTRAPFNDKRGEESRWKSNSRSRRRSG